MRSHALTARRGAALVAAGALLTGVVLTVATPAFAATGNGGVAVGWQPDASNVGPLTFYDASGRQITSGSINDSPMASYYVSSAATGTGNATAGFMQFTTPVSGQAPGSWAGTQQVGAANAFPVAGLPGDLAGFTGAVVPGAASDGSFHDVQVVAFPNCYGVASGSTNPPCPTGQPSTAGYDGLYELRMKVYKGSALQTTWYAADILVSGTTWTQVWPSQTAPTLTLATSDANPAPSGTTSVNLTATLSTAAPGNVQFYDGTTALGSPVAVSGTTASANVSGLHDQGNQLTARYIPTPGSTALGATSAVLTFCVTSCTTAPSAVADLAATAGQGKLDLGWTAPPDGGAPISDYLVTYTPSGGVASTVHTNSAAASYALTGLTNGTSYAVTVQAVNSVGTGGVSNTATGTPVGVPDAPVNVIATAHNGSAAVSFYAGANNGSAVTSYTVTASTGETASGSASPITISVANGTSRTFTVRATNAVGTGPASGASNAVAFYNSTVSIARSVGTVVAGTAVRLYGQLNSGPAAARNLVLYSYPAGHAASTRVIATTATGTWSIYVKPLYTTSYKIVYGGDSTHGAATSPLVKVYVKAKVVITSPRAGTRTSTRTLAVTGTTYPNKAGAYVYLYEVRGTLKIKLATARVASNGTFRFVRTFAKGTHVLYAMVANTTTNLAGTSARVTLYEV